MSPTLSHIRNWIFDLDNTLYTGDADFFRQIELKITDYIARYLALHPQKAWHLQKEYLAEYGTSLSGMMAVHGMDPADFLDYVHDVGLDTLSPNPALREAIKALPGRKFIYTNGSRGHARNVATHLKLYDLFDGNFGVEDADYTPKPKPEGYHIFNKRFKIDPTTAIFFEDSQRNLDVPKAMGMKTVLVRAPNKAGIKPTVPTSATVDYCTDDLAEWLAQNT